MTPPTDEDSEDDENEDVESRTHLEDVDDGCGCAEVWEELSEQRTESSTE